MKRVALMAAACGVSLLMGVDAQASPEGDRLAQCLVENSSPKDQAALVQWMFSALAANPALRSLADPSREERDRYNKALAESFERLALVDCHGEMVAAAKADGPKAISQAFEMMGRRAAEQLLSDPAATKELERFGEHLDAAKWEQFSKDVGSGAAPKPR